jgi:hypothetical protein
MRRRSRTSRDSGQSPSSIGRRNNCLVTIRQDSRHAGLRQTGARVVQERMALITWKHTTFQLRIGLLVWSLCRDRVCRLERLNPREVFPNHFFYLFSLISPIHPCGYHGRIRALLSKPCMFLAGIDFNICPLSQTSCSASPTFSSEGRSQVSALGNVAPNSTPRT